MTLFLMYLLNYFLNEGEKRRNIMFYDFSTRQHYTYLRNN